MTNTIELSKRLLECAKWHEEYGLALVLELFPATGAEHIQWAADLRSIAIPEPVGERE